MAKSIYEYESSFLADFYRYYFNLAQNGDPYAQTYIAQANYWGWGCDKNYPEFIRWDTIAANNGVVSSGRRMLLYYFNKGDFDSVGRIYDNQNPRKHNPSGFDEPGGNMFGDNWFCHITRGEFISFCKSFSNVFEFINALGEFKEWGSYAGERLVDPEACEIRGNATKLFQAICFIFGFGTTVDFTKADNYLIKNFGKQRFSVGLRYGVDSVVRDHANYLCSIYESYLPAGNKNTLNLFSKHGWLSNNIVSELDYDYLKDPNLIEFFSRHAVIFAMMGNTICANHLEK